MPDIVITEFMDAPGVQRPADRLDPVFGRALAAPPRAGTAVGAAFAGCPSLILTPPVAGVTEECNDKVGAMIADADISALEENAG